VVVLLVAAIVWVLVVVLSGVTVAGLLWGWVVPPLLLVIAWLIYDAIDDRLEAQAGRLWDGARRRS
jgi:polyferredoxin